MSLNINQNAVFGEVADGTTALVRNARGISVFVRNGNNRYIAIRFQWHECFIYANHSGW
jgi:hypothetical protein